MKALHAVPIPPDRERFAWEQPRPVTVARYQEALDRPGTFKGSLLVLERHGAAAIVPLEELRPLDDECAALFAMLRLEGP